jgi:hypothetical protein
MVASANRSDPWIVLSESKCGHTTARALNQHQRNQKCNRAESERNPTVMRLARAGREAVRDRRQGAYHGKKNQNCEQVILHSSYFGVRRQAKRDAALIIDPNRESKAPSLPAHSKVKSR